MPTRLEPYMVSNNLFAEIIRGNGNDRMSYTMFTLFKYEWSTGRIEKLYSTTVGDQFVICQQSINKNNSNKPTLAAEFKNNKIVSYEITETKLVAVAELDIGIQFLQLKTVTGSRSLVLAVSTPNMLYSIADGKIAEFIRLAPSCISAKLCLDALGVRYSFGSYTFFHESGRKITDDTIASIDGNTELVATTDDESNLPKRIAGYVGSDTEPNMALKSSADVFDLPNLGKAVFRTSEIGRSIIERFTCDKGKLVTVPVPYWCMSDSLAYCSKTGEIYILCGCDLVALNLETFEKRVVMRDESVKLLDRDTLWLPFPMPRDVVCKYVPVLEANTNLPSDLCRLVASYLDW